MAGKKEPEKIGKYGCVVILLFVAFLLIGILSDEENGHQMNIDMIGRSEPQSNPR